MPNFMDTDWIYIGIFIDDTSKDMIMNKLSENNIEIPNDWKTYMHHMTLCFNKHDRQSDELYGYYKNSIGRRVTLTCDYIDIDDQIMALAVDTEMPMQNDIAHITIAAQKGVPPVKSNYIENWKYIKPFKITGIINEFKKTDKNINESLLQTLSIAIKKALEMPDF